MNHQYILAIDIGMKNFAYAVVRMKEPLLWNEIRTCTTCIDIGHLHFEKYSVLYDFLRNVMKKHASHEFSVILIEQQYSSRHCSNIKALKIAQHVHAFFGICYPNQRVIEYPAYWKTRIFHAPYKQTKYQRKQWAISTVQDIYATDDILCEWMTCLPKKDDVCDCILMALSFPFILQE